MAFISCLYSCHHTVIVNCLHTPHLSGGIQCSHNATMTPKLSVTYHLHYIQTMDYSLIGELYNHNDNTGHIVFMKPSSLIFFYWFKGLRILFIDTFLFTWQNKINHTHMYIHSLSPRSKTNASMDCSQYHVRRILKAIYTCRMKSGDETSTYNALTATYTYPHHSHA